MAINHHICVFSKQKRSLKKKKYRNATLHNSEVAFSKIYFLNICLVKMLCGIIITNTIQPIPANVGTVFKPFKITDRIITLQHL